MGRPDRVRPSRRGERQPREHDAGVPARGRPRLHVSRDRRPRHQRRCARRLPRRRPLAHVRTTGPDRHPALERGVAGTGLAGASRSRCSRSSSASFPDARFNIDCKANSGLPGLIASLKRLDCLDRVCVGGFSDQRLRRLRAAFGDRLCSSFGPVQMASLRSGARVPFGGQLAQVPVQGRAGHDRHARPPSPAPIAAATTSTSGRSTTPTR